MLQKGSKRKEIKITIEINKTLKRQTTEKNLNLKAVSLKIVIKPSARLNKEKKRKQITNIRNIIRDISTDLTETKRIKKGILQKALSQ